jgi:hypothetical protein
MSIQALKRKGVINYGSGRSGKPPGGVWLSQGPFGKQVLSYTMSGNSPVGFSINGGTRNVGYIGQSMAMSKNGTPFYGEFAKGTGGIRGTYPRKNPVFNLPSSRCITQGNQSVYIKPSVLSQKGMLEKKYKWINNGQFPNYWVQPVYPTGTQSDSASQWLYIQTKAAANITVNDTNRACTYLNYRIIGGPLGCKNTTAKYQSFATISSNKGYTKTLGIPQDASQYTTQVQRRCANPNGALKPFPFATNGGSKNASSGIHYAPPPISQVYYVEPPLWYLTDNPNTNCYQRPC